MPIASYFRVYESLQAATPALAGFLKSGLNPTPLGWSEAIFLFAVSSQQLFLYAYNDDCDFERDRLNPRKRSSAVRSRGTMKTLTAALFLLSSVLISLLPARAAALAWGTQALGIAYSHPRISLRTRIPSAQIVHFAVGAAYFSIGRMAAGGSWGRGDIAASAYFGLLYMSGGLNNEILDLESDRGSGMKSLALALGPAHALRWAAAAQILAILILAAAWGGRGGPIASALGLIAYGASIRRCIVPVFSAANAEGFRTRYRLLFGAMTAALCVSWTR